MKSLAITLASVIVALLLVVFILSSRPVETESAGIDQTKPSSSYEQKTNHFPMPNYSMGPIQGSESPYKVNQWMSYIV